MGGLRGELSAQQFELLTMGGTEEAIVTDLDETLGQDMLHAKRAVDEFLGRQCAEPGLAGVGLVAEGDLIIFHLDDAAVAEGNAKDVGGEIFERGAQRAIADGLAMDDPIVLPHRSGDVRKAIGLAQRITARSVARKSLESALTGSKKFLRAGRHVCPSSANPPAGTR